MAGGSPGQEVVEELSSEYTKSTDVAVTDSAELESG